MIKATGGKSFALGINAKVVATGKCTHPNKRFVSEETLKSRQPISEEKLTHCIFCMRDGGCKFAGNCEYKEKDNG